MSSQGPRQGLANKLFRIGLINDHVCPECNRENIQRELTPAGESRLECPRGHTFQVGEVP